MRWIASSPTDIIIPNYLIGNYEVDVLKVTNSDYFYEYEIKVSRGDFRKDFKKGVSSKGDQLYIESINRIREENIIVNSKHEKIKSGDRCNRFYYVCPENLIKPEEIPFYAGLLYWCAPKTNPNSGRFVDVKGAPLIHKDKVSYEFYKRLAQRLSSRERDWRVQWYQEKHNHQKDVPVLFESQIKKEY